MTSEVEKVFKHMRGVELLMPLVYTGEVQVRQEQALIGSVVNLIDHQLVQDHQIVQEKDYPIEELPQPRHIRFVDEQLHKCTSVAVV